MTKIYQGELPEVINVVIDGKVITKAVFIGGVYETDNKAVVRELKEYGYKVEETKASKPDIDTPHPNPLPQGAREEVKPAKSKKKKEID